MDVSSGQGADELRMLGFRGSHYLVILDYVILY